MFGPVSTATGRPCTSVESRAPVAGSSPFVSERTGASPAERLGDRAVDGARHGENDHLGLRKRRLLDRRRLDAADVAVREIARVPARLGDHARLLRVAAGKRHVVLAVLQDTCERRPPRPAADDDEVHDRLTKSIETGTPARLKRLRSSFSTQYA